MKLLLAGALLSIAVAFSATHSSEAPTGFDNKSNGLADDATHQADQTKFDEVEAISDGLGPLYNAQSCRECHQSPVSGAASQVTELRVGHQGQRDTFVIRESRDRSRSRSVLWPVSRECSRYLSQRCLS